MFNVGDLVIGNERNEYGVTNRRTLCVVGYVDSPTRMKVFAIDGDLHHSVRKIEGDLRDFDFSSPSSSKSYFAVDTDRFRPISYEEWLDYKTAEIARVNRIFRQHPSYDKFVEYFDIRLGKEVKMVEIPKVAEPAINLNGTYNFTKKQEDYVLPRMKKLLDKYHHANTEDGIKVIWNKVKEKKAHIASILSNHPNWDEEIMSIVLESSYSRSKDDRVIKEFCDWCKDQLKKWAKKPENEYKINCCTVKEIYDARNRLSVIVDRMVSLRDANRDWGDHPNHVIFNGMTFEEVEKEHERLCELYRIADNHAHYLGAFNYKDFFVNDDIYNKYLLGCKFLDMVSNYGSHIADEDFAEKANEYAKPFNYEKNGKIIGLKAVKGQKVSRIIGKFMKYYELDKIVDERTERWISTDGTVHTRTRDYGWNGKFAELGDAINPLEIKRWTIISINPIDYLTMSFGNSWSSCQTIDKLNERRVDSEHNYSGMYCSGTLSYMLDGATVIMYTVDEHYKGKDFCLEPKINRCNFHIGEDKFIQGRLYPDGRDACSETSMSSQFREIFQKVLSECVNEPNLWKVLKGTNHCETYGKSAYGATNYQDWIHYNDCTVSFLKRNGYEENKKPVIIGHRPICPYCGEEHSTTDNLSCGNCRGKIEYDDDNIVYCAHCGEIINIEHDDYICDEDTDNYYCDEECANYGGCYYCANVEEWHSENVYEDEYNQEYFYDDYWDTCVHFTDRWGTEHHYHDIENANNDGWVEIDGEWYREDDDEIITCPHCGAYTLADREECLECGAIIEDENELDETA